MIATTTCWICSSILNVHVCDESKNKTKKSNKEISKNNNNPTEKFSSQEASSGLRKSRIKVQYLRTFSVNFKIL